MSSERQLRELTQLLSKELPTVSAQQLQRVAMVIIGDAIDCSMDELAAALLQSNVSVGRVLGALLRCEWLSVQRLMEESAPERMKQQIARFSSCVAHFNSLQEAVVKAADRQWQQQLDQERKSRVLAECRAAWLEQGQVPLHNYFREVPVAAKAPFISYEPGGHLCVRATPELGRVFAVSDSGQDAVISSPDRRFNLLVSLFQCRSNQLALSIRAVEAARQECRSEVRVGVVSGDQGSVTARLRVGNRRLDAELIDLSCSGAGLRIDGKQPDDAPPLHPGDRLALSCRLGGAALEVKQADVRWTAQSDSGLRLGVKLNVDAVQRDVIYKYLFVLQQQIAGRIHQLGAPVWMK